MKLIINKKLTVKQYKLLFDTYYPSLCLFSKKYLNDIDLSKDVVQEAFVKVWQNELVFRDEASAKSYLYTCVKNKCLDYLKSKEYRSKTNLNPENFLILESDAFFEKEVLLEEVSRIVEKAVNSLPFKCKEIITLSLNGLKNSQISEELSISINTVKTQKRIAYQKLRPLLKDCISHVSYFLLCIITFL